MRLRLRGSFTHDVDDAVMTLEDEGFFNGHLAIGPARLKEWAYSGFAITIGSALIAHLAVGDGTEAWGWAAGTGVLHRVVRDGIRWTFWLVVFAAFYVVR